MYQHTDIFLFVLGVIFNCGMLTVRTVLFSKSSPGFQSTDFREVNVVRGMVMDVTETALWLPASRKEQSLCAAGVLGVQGGKQHKENKSSQECRVHICGHLSKWEGGPSSL
jgi:hypothetical protein